MTPFTLDPRLAADCHLLGRYGCSLVLLMDNSLVPWFILVPERDAVELCDLSGEDQLALLEGINGLSRFVRNRFGIDKLNVAAIGNVVKQLHVHVVGRRRDDPFWPGVVWGGKERRPYDAGGVRELATELAAFLGPGFSPLRPETEP